MRKFQSVTVAVVLGLVAFACSKDDAAPSPGDVDGDGDGSGGTGDGDGSGGTGDGSGGTGETNSGGQGGTPGSAGEGPGGAPAVPGTPVSAVISPYFNSIELGEGNAFVCANDGDETGITFTATTSTGIVEKETDSNTFQLWTVADLGPATVTCISTNSSGDTDSASFHFNVVPAGRVAYWPLDGDADAAMPNPTFNGTYDSSKVVPAADRHGVAGGAMYFDQSLTDGGASSAHIVVPDQAALALTEFTISLFAKPSPDDYERPMISRQAATSFNYRVEIRGDADSNNPGQLRYMHHQPGIYSEYLSPNLVDGNFHHIAMVVKEGEFVLAYVDGVLSGTGNVPGSIETPAGDLRIGGTPTSSFTGILDEVILYDRALSADEIKVLSEL